MMWHRQSPETAKGHTHTSIYWKAALLGLLQQLQQDWPRQVWGLMICLFLAVRLRLLFAFESQLLHWRYTELLCTNGLHVCHASSVQTKELLLQTAFALYITFFQTEYKSFLECEHPLLYSFDTVEYSLDMAAGDGRVFLYDLMDNPERPVKILDVCGSAKPVYGLAFNVQAPELFATIDQQSVKVKHQCKLCWPCCLHYIDMQHLSLQLCRASLCMSWNVSKTTCSYRFKPAKHCLLLWLWDLLSNQVHKAWLGFVTVCCFEC